MTSPAMMKNVPKSILIVDDEEGVREVVSELISSMGFMVHKAESGEEALNLISRVEFDLVISDVKMEGMDGVALARRLRDRFPNISLGLMTALPSADVEQMLRDERVDFLLEKPFEMQELEEIVQEIV